VGARLSCPFCRAVVVDGDEPVAGSCPGCGARFAGGADSAPEAVRAALSEWGVDADHMAVARTLFELDPADADTPATVVSDERDEFYRWWVFLRPDAGPGALTDLG